MDALLLHFDLVAVHCGIVSCSLCICCIYMLPSSLFEGDVWEVKGRSERAVSRISDQGCRGESRTCLRSTFCSDANEVTASAWCKTRSFQSFIPSDPRSHLRDRRTTRFQSFTLRAKHDFLRGWPVNAFHLYFWGILNIQWETGFMHYDLIGY